MLTQFIMSFLIRMAFESVSIARVNRVMYEDIKDYHSDVKHLVSILNQFDIELDEFDYIVLNHVRRKVAENS